MGVVPGRCVDWRARKKFECGFDAERYRLSRAQRAEGLLIGFCSIRPEEPSQCHCQGTKTLLWRNARNLLRHATLAFINIASQLTHPVVLLSNPLTSHPSTTTTQQKDNQQKPLTSTKTNKKSSESRHHERPNTRSAAASPPPLNSLIRPAHILSLFRHHEQRKTHYFDGCSQLWNAILTNPQDSPAHRHAYRQLTSLTQTIKDAMARQKATERETARHAERSRQERLLVLQRQRQRVAREQSAFRTLVRQVAGAVPVPSLADFEAGLSAFHPGAAVGSGLDDGGMRSARGMMSRRRSGCWMSVRRGRVRRMCTRG
ncbi:hypothetical protein HO173_000529 [Letharia columbiana]|uniref:Uncharacterized protein n=1 Tax=Letharia columbiana TaxID=112416 RepID=A0A8H6G777_9LECA|nr:uncharacterized protein HO173_000529 [Letharia columbiana]KAF6241817.1 hypothetical protein HO173_000529 [Letharia columbiana]